MWKFRIGWLWSSQMPIGVFLVSHDAISNIGTSFLYISKIDNFFLEKSKKLKKSENHRTQKKSSILLIYKKEVTNLLMARKIPSGMCRSHNQPIQKLNLTNFLIHFSTLCKGAVCCMDISSPCPSCSTNAKNIFHTYLCNH